MADTKEKILITALELFARDGYEAVSVRDISLRLGITKSALYKHYQNKRAIFDSIVARMYRIDRERADAYRLPAHPFEQEPLSYGNRSMEQITSFLEAQFRFWTEDAFARDFRKMLLLEQYRNPEIADLYHTCLVDGPVAYTEDLIRELRPHGDPERYCARQLALALYAPFFLLLSEADCPQKKEEAGRRLRAHITHFTKTYFPKKQ